MIIIEVNPLPEVCKKCEQNQEEFDCTSCSFGLERFILIPELERAEDKRKSMQELNAI